MSQYGGYGLLTEHQVRQMGFCLDDAVRFICENHDDLERVADTFACGDLDEAFKMILGDGLQRYLDLCDIDDEMKDYEETKQELMCAKRTIEYLRGGDDQKEAKE